MMQIKKRIKGFTLTELIVVIAIIGILAAILAPTMITYYRRSRLKDANSDARMVYNAAQTAVQRFISVDRVRDPSDFSLFNGVVMISGRRDGTVMISTEENSVFTVPEADSPEAEACTAIADAVGNVVSDSDMINWAVYVDHYMVKACISADRDESNFVGQYSAGRAVANEISLLTYAEMLPADGNPNNELARIAHQEYDGQVADET